MIQSDSLPSSRSEDGRTVNTYRLCCTDCSFETTVNGDSFDALEVAEAHQDEYEDPFADHFVNFAVEERERTH